MELTKQKDTDFKILLDLPDVDFFKLCAEFNSEDALELTNKYFNQFCNNETLWKERLFKYYGKFYPEEGQSWKNMYLKLVYYMDKYEYSKYSRKSFENASIYGHLEVVKFLYTFNLKHRGEKYLHSGVRLASGRGHLDVVKYLSSLNVLDENTINSGIRSARENNHPDVVKYLSNLQKNNTK